MNVTVTSPSPGEATTSVGANGTPGVTDTASEGSPATPPTTPRRAMSYFIPLVKPGIVTGDVSSAGSNGTHDGGTADGFNVYS